MDKQLKRTPCEIHTRVMGYYRPVSQFNPGKKSEFYSRKYFNTPNEKFISDYQSLPGATDIVKDVDQR